LNPSEIPSVIRRVLSTVNWGETVRDKSLIAAYYALTLGFKLFRPDRPIDAGMHPGFWLGNIEISTPIGRFVCRGRTSDADIVNPNHEAALVNAIRDRLARIQTRKPIMVDIGAHIGKYTILSGRLLKNSGTVVALEADPANFALLKKNITLNNLNNVVAFNLGCWSSDGKLILHRQLWDLGGHSFVDKTRGDSIPVPVRTLDGVLRDSGIDHVDVMKIDVQRAEAEVLRGARATLQLNPNVAVFFEETSDIGIAESARILRDSGFNLKRLDDFNYVAERLLA
jgi:FkbM family methyltransferase